MKTQLKKEQLETEIEILENKAKLKRHELRHSVVSPSRHQSIRVQTPSNGVHRNMEYDYIPNRLPSAEALRQSLSKSPVCSQTIKPGINYEDVII